MKVTCFPTATPPTGFITVSHFFVSVLLSSALVTVHSVTSTGRGGKGMGMASFFPSRELQTLPLQMEKCGDDASIMQPDPQQMSSWFCWRGLGEGLAGKAALN